jgi:predicted phosphodiesterase
MRYLVFGDVHANVLALDTVLAAAHARGADAFLFVGDLIGYGPNPLECIERLLPLVQRGNMAWVAGNHELALRGDVEMSGYSAEAMQTLEWTRKLVDSKPWAKDFIDSAYLTTCANDTIWLTHDSLVAPSSGSYHRWPQSAKSELACLRHNEGRICFYGHTHTMRAEVCDDEQGIMLVPMTPHESDGMDANPIKLRRADLGWIGTGSVGFPTNPKRHPEFLILDETNTRQWQVEKYAVEYPREEARERTRTILGSVCDKEVAERIARWL